MNSEPYRVGLTGNIAAGKSEVAEAWRALGAVVVDADTLARRAVEPGSPGLAAVVAEFGEGVQLPDGSLDRAALGRLVFADPAARRRLEAIVHPEVARLRPLVERAALANAAAQRRGRGEVTEPAIVVHDIPLLFEAGLGAGFDEIVVVHAPRPARLDRLIRARGMEAEDAQARIDAQMPADEKLPRADVVILNDAGLGELGARAASAWREILERAARARPDAASRRNGDA